MLVVANPQRGQPVRVSLVASAKLEEGVAQVEVRSGGRVEALDRGEARAGRMELENLLEVCHRLGGLALVKEGDAKVVDKEDRRGQPADCVGKVGLRRGVRRLGRLLVRLGRLSGRLLQCEVSELVVGKAIV